MSREKPTKNHHPKRRKELPYAKITNAVILSRQVSAFDLRVYSVLCTHYNSITGKTFPSIAKIAQETGFHINTVKASRSRLKELELIKWRLDRTEKNSCQYELPLITGSYKEQQRIIESLRLGCLTAQPSRVVKQAKARVVKQANARVVKQATNYKKEQEEINNKVDAVLSFTFQIQEQRPSLQKIWEDWQISSEKLKEYSLSDVLLWTEYIRKRTEEGYKVESPAGYLVNALQKKRKAPDREGKIRELIDEWLPYGRDEYEEDEDYWFPRWQYLVELSQEHKKPVSDLLKEGILDDLTVRDDLRDVPLLEEFTPEQLKMMEEGKFEEELSKHNRGLARQQAQREKVKKLRRDPERFFESIKEKFWEVIKE